MTSFQVYVGESWSIRISSITDSTGAAIDPGDADLIEFEVKRKPGDADPPILAKSLGDGVEVVDGEVVVTGEPADTVGMVGIYFYDVVLVIGDERYLVASPAAFLVLPSVNLP